MKLMKSSLTSNLFSFKFFFKYLTEDRMSMPKTKEDSELKYALTVEEATLKKRLREIQEERFKKEIATMQNRGVASEGELQWVDVAERFYPLGLKSIGILCEEISRAKWAYGDKYIVGFQDFPREIPLLGKFAGGDTKVSMRVPLALREDIEERKKPYLTEILPAAAQEAGGLAEGCHRFAAACIIPQKNKMALIRSLTRIVKDWPPSLPVT